MPTSRPPNVSCGGHGMPPIAVVAAAADRSLPSTRPVLAIVSKPDAHRIECPQLPKRRVISRAIAGGRPAFSAVRFAQPLSDRVDRLSGEDGGSLDRGDEDRLVARGMAGRC